MPVRDGRSRECIIWFTPETRGIFKRFRRKPYIRSLLLTVQNMSERTDGMWKKVYNEKE